MVSFGVHDLALHNIVRYNFEIYDMVKDGMLWLVMECYDSLRLRRISPTRHLQIRSVSSGLPGGR
jgi:hypothetical protein